MATVLLDDVTVRKGESVVLDGVSLQVDDGQLMAILGPSGSGKSTLLRAVAGLDRVESGAVRIGDVDVTDVPPSRRRLAMVFQDNALFPFLDVRHNISFPLDVQRTPPGEIEERVDAEARVLAIEHLLEQMPGRLSAAHQQLVQAARALVRVPDAFLMDEPLARLDQLIRAALRREIRLLQQGYGVTTLYVSNDPEESMAVADQMAVLDDGRIVQVGRPLDLYRRPVSRVVATLVGTPPMPIVSGRVVAGPAGARVAVGPVRLRGREADLGRAVGRSVDIGIRPEQVVVDPDGVAATVVGVENYGSHSHVLVSLDDDVTVLMRSGHVPPALFSRIRVRLLGLHVFDQVTGEAVCHMERLQQD